MKKSVVFLLAALASFGAFAKTPVNKPQDPVFGVHSKILNGEKVSPLIEAKFQQQYGSSANVSWSVVDDASDVRITIATFTEGGEQKEVYYYEDGEVFGIGRTIRREELPDHVTSSIHSRFSSGVIQTAYELK